MRCPAIAIACCLFQVPLAAQPADSPVIGQWLWVREAHGGGRLDNGVQGMVLRLAGDTIHLEPRPGAAPIPVVLRDGSYLFVRAGEKSLMGAGAVIGAALGGVLGGVTEFVDTPSCGSEDFLCFDGLTVPLANIGAGAGIGLVAGLLIGSQFRTTVWESLDRTTLARALVIAPGASGLRIGARLKF